MSKPDLRLLTQWLNPVLVSGLEDRRYLKKEWCRHRKLATLETLWLMLMVCFRGRFLQSPGSFFPWRLCNSLVPISIADHLTSA